MNEALLSNVTAELAKYPRAKAHAVIDWVERLIPRLGKVYDMGLEQEHGFFGWVQLEFSGGEVTEVWVTDRGPKLPRRKAG